MSTFVILAIVGLIISAVLFALVMRGPLASSRRPPTGPVAPEPPSGPRTATQATRMPGILPEPSARKAEEITPHTGIPLRDPGPGP